MNSKFVPFRPRDPLRHSNVALRARNENLTLRYLTTSSYLSPRFLDIFSARDLWNIEHSWLITPVVVKINGVKEPCSTSIIRRLYCLFFSDSCLRRTALMEESCWLLLSGFVTLTSKNVFCPSRQNPRARTSRRAENSTTT